MRLIHIHYLRGFSALLVVIAHNSHYISTYLEKKIPGALGVDIFFILSGFIINLVHSKKNEDALGFILKRFFRIFPAYLFIWILFFLLVNRDISHNYCSLYFCLNNYSAEGPSFGYSALGPPWTLTYEIVFYMLYSFSFVISFKYKSHICSLFIVLCIILPQLFFNGNLSIYAQHPLHIPKKMFLSNIITVISNPINFEFVIGIYLSEMFRKNMLPEIKLYFLYAMVVLSILSSFLIGPQLFGAGGGMWLASIIFILVMLIDHRDGKFSPRFYPAVFMGDISYSLYISHVPVRDFLLRCIHINGYVFSFFSISISIILSAFMFKFIETPFNRFGKFLYQKWTDRAR